MAKIEVNKIIASSKDNFLVFSNDSFSKPMVTFTFTNMGSGDGKIHIKDALNEDGFNKVIVYSPREIISDSTFKYVSGDNTANTFSLLECLRKNSIFYDLTLETNGSSVTIKAYIDTSTRYIITADEEITVGGSYSSYVAKEPNKFVLMLNDGSNQIMLDKYTTENEVSFNVSSPYEHLSFKHPKNIRMIAYHIDNNTAVSDPISNNNIYILPTTLTKFSDVDLMSYFLNYSGQKVNFLTNNFHRYYNYGEICGLSMLVSDDMNNITLTKNYYTLGGKFLGTDTNLLYTETNNLRKDFYFTLDLEGIETRTNKQVGYVEVFATVASASATNTIRYDIVPKCNENHEIFFVNELGGIDSFNFLGESKYSTKIKNLTTYLKNPTRKFEETKELEIIGGKKNDVENVLTTTIIGKDTAKWLNELSKSKYPFLYLGSSGSRFERIVITDMDISLSDRENTFEIEMTYKNGDNAFKL